MKKKWRHLIISILSFFIPIVFWRVAISYSSPAADIESILFVITIGIFVQFVICYANIFYIRVANIDATVAKVISYIGLLPFLIFISLFVFANCIMGLFSVAFMY